VRAQQSGKSEGEWPRGVVVGVERGGEGYDKMPNERKTSGDALRNEWTQFEERGQRGKYKGGGGYKGEHAARK
jgi:hypothetical protein